MKTNITSLGKPTLKGIQKLFIGALILLLSGNCMAQSSKLKSSTGTLEPNDEPTISNKLKFGVALSRSSNGDGTGWLYTPALILTKNRSLFEFSANVQKKRMNVAGGQFTYEYNVTRGSNAKGRRMELFVFSNAKFVLKAYLNARTVKIEEWVDKEDVRDFTSMKITTISAYTGFGTRTWLSNRLLLTNSIGVGAFNTIHGPGHLHREDHSMSINLKLGLNFYFN